MDYSNESLLEEAIEILFDGDIVHQKPPVVDNVMDWLSLMPNMNRSRSS